VIRTGNLAEEKEISIRIVKGRSMGFGRDMARVNGNE
jgi:hypothetical protein